MSEQMMNPDIPLEVLVLEQSSLTTWERAVLQYMKASNIQRLSELSTQNLLQSYIARMAMRLEAEFLRIDALMTKQSPDVPEETLKAMSHHLHHRRSAMEIAIDNILVQSTDEEKLH